MQPMKYNPDERARNEGPSERDGLDPALLGLADALDRAGAADRDAMSPAFADRLAVLSAEAARPTSLPIAWYRRPIARAIGTVAASLALAAAVLVVIAERRQSSRSELAGGVVRAPEAPVALAQSVDDWAEISELLDDGLTDTLADLSTRAGTLSPEWSVDEAIDLAGEGAL